MTDSKKTLLWSATGALLGAGVAWLGVRRWNAPKILGGAGLGALILGVASTATEKAIDDSWINDPDQVAVIMQFGQQFKDSMSGDYDVQLAMAQQFFPHNTWPPPPDAPEPNVRTWAKLGEIERGLR